jgi:diacylglycerol kinase (ATP)
MPLRQWFKSANFAIEGILHAAKTQRHLRYHFYAAFIVLVGSYALGVSREEFLFIALAVIAVLVAEMLNTSVESVVDLISPEHHERAREAKDIAAGAVMITAFGAAVIGFVVLMPHLEDLFRTGINLAPRPSGEIAVLAFVLVLIVVVLLKAMLGKGRPLSGGMPSGHTALAFSVLVSVIFTTRNLIASGLCLLLALFIAQSRITTRVHSPLEVVSGALLGAGLTVVLFLVFA